jgi:hypothetical protein
MLNTLETLQNTAAAVADGVLIRIEAILRKAFEYFTNSNRTKLSVSELFHSFEFISDISSIRQFLQEVVTRGAFLFESWLSMATRVQHIWDDVITDRDLKEYYVYKNYSNFLRNVSVVKYEIDRDFHMIRSQNDLRFVLWNKDVLLFEAVDNMQAELLKFNASTIFNENVLK